jgi:HK97 family phage major capsid protein
VSNYDPTRLGAVADRFNSIIKTTDGRDLTAPQKRDWAAATAELVAMSEAMPADTAVGHAYNELVRCIAEGGDSAAAKRDVAVWSGELARLAKIEQRSREVDSVRSQFGGLFDQSDVAERTFVRSGRTIADMMREVRETGAMVVHQYSAKEYEATLGGPTFERVLATSTNTVPAEFDFEAALFSYQRQANPMNDPGVVTLIVRDEGRTVTVPRLTADANSAGDGTVTAENAAITEADPTLGSIALSPFGYKLISNYSNELDLDAGFVVQTAVAGSMGRQLGLDIGKALTVGDGSGDPNGFITAATNGGTAAGTAAASGSNFISWEDLVDLDGSMQAYPNRSWQLAPSALTHILKFQGATEADPIIIPGLAGAPSTLLGHPLRVNPAMASIGSASKSVAVGDFSYYVVVRTPTRIEVSRDYKWSTDATSVRVVERADGDLLHAGAISYLVSAAD